MMQVLRGKYLLNLLCEAARRDHTALEERGLTTARRLCAKNICSDQESMSSTALWKSCILERLCLSQCSPHRATSVPAFLGKVFMYQNSFRVGLINKAMHREIPEHWNAYHCGGYACTRVNFSFHKRNDSRQDLQVTRKSPVVLVTVSKMCLVIWIIKATCENVDSWAQPLGSAFQEIWPRNLYFLRFPGH